MTAPGDSADQRRRLRVGLTGGIASGKTTVANLFAEHGADVIDTDVIARQVVEPGTQALAEVVEAFGPDILGTDGRVDRAALRQIVFSDASARRKLEAILHPVIGYEMLRQAAESRRRYVVFVIPLLIEAGMQDVVDRILVVDCPVSTQIERLMRRDGGTESDARKILGAQVDRQTRLAAADDVIVNDGDLAGLAVAVRRQHERYLALAG